MKMNKRILHVIPSMSPSAGGTRAGLFLLCRHSVELGVDSEVLCLDDRRDEFLKDLPFIVHALGPSKPVYRKCASLVPWLKENHQRYTAIVIHGIWQYHSLATWIALRKTETPYYVYVHGMLGPWFKKAYPAKHIKKWLYWPWADYRVLRDAKAVLFTCEQERLQARKSFWLYSANEIVTGFGAESNFTPNAINRFLENYYFLRDKRILLFVGRLHPVKGCDLLVSAFIENAHIDPNLHLVLIGPDQEGLRDTLEMQANQANLHNRIHFLGMLDGQDKWDAYRSAELFVLPSHHENFGVTIAESMSCGTPVLITDQVNIHQTISEEKGGLVATDTVEGISSKLREWLMLSDFERQQFREQAFRCYQQNYTLDIMTKGMLVALGVDV